MLAAITQARVIADHFLNMFIADTTFGLIGRDGIASIFIKRASGQVALPSSAPLWSTMLTTQLTG